MLLKLQEQEQEEMSKEQEETVKEQEETLNKQKMKRKYPLGVFSLLIWMKVSRLQLEVCLFLVFITVFYLFS